MGSWDFTFIYWVVLCCCLFLMLHSNYAMFGQWEPNVGVGAFDSSSFFLTTLLLSYIIRYSGLKLYFSSNCTSAGFNNFTKEPWFPSVESNI